MNRIRPATALSDRVAYHSYDPNLPVVFDQISSLVQHAWIAFRDHLRTHPEDTRAYNRVKQQAIAAGSVEGGRYQQAKTPFLVSVMEKIQQQAK